MKGIIVEEKRQMRFNVCDEVWFCSQHDVGMGLQRQQNKPALFLLTKNPMTKCSKCRLRFLYSWLFLNVLYVPINQFCRQYLYIEINNMKQSQFCCGWQEKLWWNYDACSSSEMCAGVVTALYHQTNRKCDENQECSDLRARRGEVQQAEINTQYTVQIVHRQHTATTPTQSTVLLSCTLVSSGQTRVSHISTHCAGPRCTWRVFKECVV